MEYKWPDLHLLRSTATHNYRLREHTPRPSTLLLLQKLYPAVDWNRVDFYEGLPWFTPMAAPYVSAQALPDFFSFSRYRIYLKKYDETRAQCLADIVHEAYHVMQAMSFNKGYGIGFLRPWMLYYLADFFRNGYRQNVFEIPAFDQEYRFLAFCEAKGFHGIEPRLEPEKILAGAADSGLVVHRAPMPRDLAWWAVICSFLLCVLIAVLKLPLDLLMGAVWLMRRNRAGSIVKS